MSLKTVWNVAGSLSVLVLIISATVPAVVADPAIYRCGPAGSQWYSQIPCEEDSEQVVVEDHQMFKESGVAGSAANDFSQAEGGSADHADAASKAQAFITQLEKQRNEQLAEIDRNIVDLESRSAKVDEGNEQDTDAKEAANLLASMQNTRESIASEYDAMISAARQRIETP